ncbi:MAG: hypothetical protein R6U58_10660 [Bacteroidales bacterium]
MIRQLFTLFMFLIILACQSVAQDFRITPPELNFDGNRLNIAYDILSDNSDDLFYVWVEIEKQNGEAVRVKTPEGDVGEKIKPGRNKRISWVPETDMVFLNEEVFVEIKAERYLKSFSKGSLMLKSAVLPGLGQSSASGGRPWWLAGVATYGALAAGFITYQGHLSTYDLYLSEDDPFNRVELFDKAQSQRDIANVLFISGAAAWAANMIWMVATPDRYQPLRHAPFAVNPYLSPYYGNTGLIVTIKF